MGGVEKVADKKDGGGLDGFDENRIVIPVGITPQTLKNYTLYDMLGLAGDLGATANTEVRVGGVRGGVLGAFGLHTTTMPRPPFDPPVPPFHHSVRRPQVIKKAYHKAVLVYHPDKVQHKTDKGKEDRSVFLKVQEAFNVLSNETKRRAYDSQMPFDETVPSEEKVLKALAKGPYKFFKVRVRVCSAWYRVSAAAGRKCACAWGECSRHVLLSSSLPSPPTSRHHHNSCTTRCSSATHVSP